MWIRWRLFYASVHENTKSILQCPTIYDRNGSFTPRPYRRCPMAPFTRGRSRQPNVITLEMIDTENTESATSEEGWGKSAQHFSENLEYLTKDVKNSLTRDAIVKVRGTLGNFTGSKFSIESAKILTDPQEVTPIGSLKLSPRMPRRRP